MPEIYPPFIFGMHDRGGEHLILGKNKPGWVLVTEAVGADPNNHGGSDYTDLANQGLGVLVRINHGYGTAGTIPYSSQYDDFARRCGNFVEASSGCHVWIIGNEMNLAYERPGGPGGQVITPQLYASCFAKCRNEILSRPGHGEDQVIPGAVGPWNTQTTYSGNLSGDWIRYFRDILDLLGGGVDGLAVHTYTHGQEPHLVFDNAKMNPPFERYHWHFRAYRDFMNAIPSRLRDRPVYLTETDQYGAWRDQNSGWVRNAYQEIDDWNQNPANQPIQSLVLFRWIIGNPNDPQQVGWAIENKPGVQDDFRDAMNNEYRVVLPHIQPDYRVAWLEVNAPTQMPPAAVTRFSTRVRNDGRSTWADAGAQEVRLGYRWIDPDGNVLEGQQRTRLPRPVLGGETVTLSETTVQSPEIPNYYTLELDMVEGTSGWFSAHGSPTWQLQGVRVGPLYRVAWLSVDAPSQGAVSEKVRFPVQVRNIGSFTWPPDGPNPVHLTYKWLDADGTVVVEDGLRTQLGREVPPQDEIALDAQVQFPAEPGQYVLRMDMVHEFVVWFHWKGSLVYDIGVTVEAAAPDYAAEWLDYDAPLRLAAGESGYAYIEIRNAGAKSWPKSGEDAVSMGYRWLDSQGVEVPVPGYKTWPLPKVVAPGDTAVLHNVEFVAPDAPASYLLVWDLVQDGAWLSDKGVAVLEQPMQVVAGEYGVEWQVLDPWPAQVRPGAEIQASLRLKNTGTKAWPASGAYPVHLAYTWFTEDGSLSEPWDTFRTRLPQAVLPGETVDLDTSFKAPEVLGSYILRCDLLEEELLWFFRHGGAPLEVSIEVADTSLLVPWMAQASHNSDELAMALDGNPNSAWDSKANQTPGMWFKVDMGLVLVLDRVRVASPGRGFPVGYRIWLSEDGQDWRLAAEKTRNWANVEAAFAPRQARYLRMEQTGQPDWPATWMISEIMVSVTNAWAGATAGHFAGSAGRAIDARLDTAWSTRNAKQRPGMWFQLDMGSPRRVERVSLEHPPNRQPRGYIMEVSVDGLTWQEVARNDDNWGRAEASFPAERAQHIRVRTTNSSPYHPWGICGIGVWRSAPTWLVGRAD
jgi:hypothetical protein